MIRRYCEVQLLAHFAAHFAGPLAQNTSGSLARLGHEPSLKWLVYCLVITDSMSAICEIGWRLPS